MTCPRNFTKEQMIEGLNRGMTLIVDRRDAPELLELLDWEKKGFLLSRLKTPDEQSSALQFRIREGKQLDANS